MVNFGRFHLLAQKQLPTPLPNPTTAPWQEAVPVFQEQLASSLWPPAWLEKNPVLQISRIPVVMLIAASYLRDTNKEAGSHCCGISSHCCKPLLSGEVTSRGFKGGRALLFPFPWCFSFFPFWEPDIEDQDIQK